MVCLKENFMIETFEHISAKLSAQSHR